MQERNSQRPRRTFQRNHDSFVCTMVLRWNLFARAGTLVHNRVLELSMTSEKISFCKWTKCKDASLTTVCVNVKKHQVKFSLRGEAPLRRCFNDAVSRRFDEISLSKFVCGHPHLTLALFSLKLACKNCLLKEMRWVRDTEWSGYQFERCRDFTPESRCSAIASAIQIATLSTGSCLNPESVSGEIGELFVDLDFHLNGFMPVPPETKERAKEKCVEEARTKPSSRNSNPQIGKE